MKSVPGRPDVQFEDEGERVMSELRYAERCAHEAHEALLRARVSGAPITMAHDLERLCVVIREELERCAAEHKKGAH